MEQNKHQLRLSDFSDLELSGVKEVLGFDEEQIELALPDGILYLTGKHLKIESFSRDSGLISVTGTIDSIVRENKGAKRERRFFSRFHA